MIGALERSLQRGVAVDKKRHATLSPWSGPGVKRPQAKLWGNVTKCRRWGGGGRGGGGNLHCTNI